MGFYGVLSQESHAEERSVSVDLKWDEMDNPVGMIVSANKCAIWMREKLPEPAHIVFIRNDGSEIKVALTYEG